MSRSLTVGRIVLPLMIGPLLVVAMVGSGPDIIRRHDTPDSTYVAFAKQVPAVSAVVRYNATDVAGTLIALQWILSAAHVAETLDPGAKLLASSGDTLDVDRVVVHPGWIDNGRPEDLALIRLAQPVAGVRPVPVYTESDEMGEAVVIAGNGDFGTGVTGPVGNDGRIRAATNRVDRVTDDYLIWTFDDPRSHTNQATRLEGISGPGDSGGPAFIRVGDDYRVAGISSGQRTAATGGKEGRYGVTEYYTRLSTYHNWIRETMSN